MKKFLLNGLLLLMAMFIGAGTFSSCTDDHGDDLAMTQAQVNNLQKEIDALKVCRDECQAKWDQLLNTTVPAIQDSLKAHAQLIAALEASVKSLDERIAELETVQNRYKELGLTPDSIANWMKLHSIATDATIKDLNGRIDSIRSTFATNEDFNALKGRVNDVETLLADYSDVKADVKQGVEAWQWMQDKKAFIESFINNTKNVDWANFENDWKKVQSLNDSITVMNEKIGNNNLLINGLTERMVKVEEKFAQITKNAEDIAKLQDDFNKFFGLKERLDKLVTGIINQATTNPVFGGFNTPFGVQSNMLLTYYGTSAHGFAFPSNSSAAEYNGSLVLTAKDMQMLQSCGLQPMNIAEGQKLMDGQDGNAGMIFLTINPNNVDFTGLDLTMVNSQDYASAMQLKNLKKSDKVLQFGISRAAENNAFYEAQATIDPARVNEVAVQLEPGLKSAFKNALRNHGKKDFAQLAKVLYKQMEDVLPAQGLKASWTAPDGAGNMTEYAVYSKYDIAATAVPPLSFKFMEGESIDKKFPTFTPLDEFQFDKSKFTFDIDVPKFQINNINVNIKLGHVEITPAGDILVVVKVPTSVNPDGSIKTEKDVVVNLKDDINKILKQVQQDVNGEIDKWNAEIERQLGDAFTSLKKDIEKQVNDMMKDVTGQIDSNIDRIIDEINKEVSDAVGGYFSKANKVINKYNELANKLNKVLDNPNYYLQSMACYKGTDGDFHQLSNAIAMPSPFKLAGGNAITIYMTSYNAEIIVPSYKKFIAVTNVWNEATGKSAQDGDAQCVQLLKEANGQQFMNQVLTGKQMRVAFAASKPGYKYEIVYSALDYRGWTSTRKYYVSVN